MILNLTNISFYFLLEYILIKGKMKCLSNLMIDNIDSIS